jgi:uncharacterized protein YgbK (DUF1537 family)
MYLGCIGDDFTGSSDLGNMLTKAGMHVVQYSGIPEICRLLVMLTQVLLR